MQSLRRESPVDFQTFYVTILVITKVGEYQKNIFGRDYKISVEYFKVRTFQPLC